MKLAYCDYIAEMVRQALPSIFMKRSETGGVAGMATGAWIDRHGEWADSRTNQEPGADSSPGGGAKAARSAFQKTADRVGQSTGNHPFPRGHHDAAAAHGAAKAP